jgi:predicted aspartyl protease
MAATYGTLQEFKPDAESVKAYFERVALYFTANDVPAEKQVAILLSCIGAPIYSLLSDLFAPDTPGSKTIVNISEALSNHFEPQRSVITERFHFHKRSQAVDESVAVFDAALRRLAANCQFGDTLQDTLRDRFVCGLRHENIQRRLLSEKTLTYDRAIEIARGMEAADQDTRAFKSNPSPINKLVHDTPELKSDRQLSCYRCGRGNHSPANCKFRNSRCHACGKIGHIAPVCKSKSPVKPGVAPRQKKYPTNLVEAPIMASDESDSSDTDYKIHQLGKTSADPIIVSIQINGKMLDMEVDTGAAFSVISETTGKHIFARKKLNPSDLKLKTYTDENMVVTGTLNVRVHYTNQNKKLKLVVVAGNGPSLIGRNWLKYIKLNWNNVFAVRTAKFKPLRDLLQQHEKLFTNELGKIQPFTASIHVHPDATPRFFKPRPVPFAIKDAISQELKSLEQQGIITPITHSQWAAQIVAVPKRHGRFRICGDFKVTVNQALAVEEYPLPTTEEMFATLSGGKVFSELDLSQAYLQLPVNDASKPFLVINTHRGLYMYNRLPFGVASAPAIFQKTMETVLQGIEEQLCYIDDILVSSEDEESHLITLSQIFSCLEKHGFKLKMEKCEFLLSSIEYLGHIISSDGIQPVTSKIDAIVHAPTPNNVQQLRSFLGLTNYYGKFIPNLSALLHPLNSLLRTKQKWDWSSDCDKAFEEIKKQLTSAKVLTHYNPALELTLAADASAYGVGAVISHVLPDGNERPIAFASRTLTASERNYAQLEKEALALIFGVKNFHRYLYGRMFTLITDHRPLTTILGPKKGIPSLAAARLQRYCLRINILSSSDIQTSMLMPMDFPGCHCHLQLQRFPHHKKKG